MKLKHTLAILLLATGWLCAASPIYLAPDADCDILTDCKGRLNGRLSSIRLWHDRDSIHVDATCESWPGKTISARGKSADDPAIFGGDHLEIMVTPRPREEQPRYYHIAVNPEGLVYSALRRDISWNPDGITADCSLDKEGRRWTLHLTLPFAALGAGTPAPGEQWRILVSRGAENICMAKDYHDVSQHCPLIFSPAPEPRRRLNQVRLNGARCEFDFDSRNFPGKVRVRIISGNRVLCNRKVKNTGGHFTCAADLGGYIPLKGLHPVCVQVTDLKGRLLYERTGVLQGDDQDALVLDAYYLLPGSKLRYTNLLGNGTTFRISDAAGTVLQGKAQPSGSLLLPPGRSGRMTVRFQSADGHFTSRVINVLPEAPGPLTLAEGPLTLAEGRKILRGGKPVFLLGPSASEKTHFPFPPEFNFTSGGTGLAQDASRVCNLPVGTYQRQPFSSRRYGSFEAYRRKLEDFFSSVPSQDNLYRICYEANIPLAVIDPSSGKMIPEDSAPYMSKIYRQCKKLHPELLFSIQIDSIPRIPDYKDSCDVLEIACGSSSYGQFMIPTLNENLKQVMEGVPEDKPVMLWLGGTIPDPLCRTAEELHAAVYISMMQGISGHFIHMGHQQMAAERGRIWSFLSGISREIDSIYPVVALGSTIPGFLENPPQSGFLWKAYADERECLLIAVNTEAIEQRFQASLPDGTALDELFTPYEVRTWRWKRSYLSSLRN